MHIYTCLYIYIYSNLEFIRTNSNSTRSRFSHKYSQAVVVAVVVRIIVSKLNERVLEKNEIL